MELTEGAGWSFTGGTAEYVTFSGFHGPNARMSCLTKSSRSKSPVAAIIVALGW
jgi:hypothetical protein